MKKYLCVTILVIFLLTACAQGGIKAHVPDTSEGLATQIIVEQFITAYKSDDADLLISLFHEDYSFMDYGLGDGPVGKGPISYAIKEAMSTHYYEVDFNSYLVTPEGRFAVTQGSYAQAAKSTGKWITVPAYAVLEFKDCKVLAETWYYDGSVFH